jgi:hypothetical protein
MGGGRVAVPGFLMLPLGFWSFRGKFSGWAPMRMEDACDCIELSAALSCGGVT